MAARSASTAGSARSDASKLIKPGAKAYLDIPYQQMVQHGLRPSNKLSHTVFGPFPIVKQHTANSFELDLGTSASKRVINVFHVKYLRHAPENDPYQQPKSQPPLQDGTSRGVSRAAPDRRAHRAAAIGG